MTPLGVAKHGQRHVRPGRQGAVHRDEDAAHGARGARRDRLPRRRGDGDRRVRLAGQVREVRDQAAARRRPPDRVRPPDHAVAVPLRRRCATRCASARASSARSSSRRARWSTTCASASRARRRSTFIGGVSTDHSGFGVGRLLDVDAIRERILALHDGPPSSRRPRLREFTLRARRPPGGGNP